MCAIHHLCQARILRCLDTCCSTAHDVTCCVAAEFEAPASGLQAIFGASSDIIDAIKLVLAIGLALMGA